MITLTFLSGPRAGELLTLEQGRWSVGRAPDNAVAVPDPSISVRHAELVVGAGELTVRDLGSRNGTFVAGARVQAQSPVEPGQVFRFGAVEMQLRSRESSESDNASAVTAAHALRRVKPAAITHSPAAVTPEPANSTETFEKAIVPAPAVSPQPPRPTMPAVVRPKVIRRPWGLWAALMVVAIFGVALWRWLQ